jgi:hypothetical protein
MIVEALGLTGSGMAGAIFSLLSDWRASAREAKDKELSIRLAQEARLQGQTIDFLNTPGGFVTSKLYGSAFLMLVATYCICIVLCIMYPHREIWTFDPDSIPRKFDFLWGFISWDLGSKYVFRLTLGGVAYGLLHLLAFQIGTVITGISPTERRR